MRLMWHIPGLAGVLVEDAKEAYDKSTANGARGVLEPTTRHDAASDTEQVISEIELYGDVVLRFVSGSFKVSFSNLTPQQELSEDRWAGLGQSISMLLRIECNQHGNVASCRKD
jgi:hypothetical protein